MAITSRFTFVGELAFPKETEKTAFIKKGKTKSGADSLRLSLGVKENDHNMCWTELFGFKKDIIKTKDVDNNDIEINWEDRLDEDIIKTIANYRLFTINLGEEAGGRQSFVSEMDFIEYLKDHIDEVKNKRFVVTGQVQFNPYKGKISTRYQIQNIYVVTDEKTKNGLTLTMDLYYGKDSLDTADWNEEKILGLDAYVPQYINKDEGTKYFPQRFVLNCQKLDMNNEKHKAQFEYRKDFMTVKGKKYVHMPWRCKVINGSEEVEITYDMLSKKQQQSIDLGLKTLDDFKKKTFGDRIQEFRLVMPIIEMEEFEDGYVELDETAAEFEEMIYTFAEDESLEDVMKEAKKEEPSSKVSEPEEEDLFG